MSKSWNLEIKASIEEFDTETEESRECGSVGAFPVIRFSSKEEATKWLDDFVVLIENNVRLEKAVADDHD